MRLAQVRSHARLTLAPSPRTVSVRLNEVTIIGKKPGQSVDKRRREREKHFKKQEKAARKAARLEENARRRAAGEDYPQIVIPEDLEDDEDSEEKKER